ncbi:MAG: hypothetical protein ACK5MD_00485 [Flavobacteriales bacterium]
MKNIVYLFLFLGAQWVQAQYSPKIIGDWTGWYVEGQKHYDVQLKVEKFNGIYYEGTITLIYTDKVVRFSIEGTIEKDIFKVTERDMISQFAPEYVINPQWCKADYNFAFSDLGDRFQLKGMAKVPDVNIAYIRGVKVYDSPKCRHFEGGEIKLQRKNSDYAGEVHLEKEKEKVVYVEKKPSNPFEVISRELIGQPKEYERVVVGGSNPTTKNREKTNHQEKNNSKPRIVYKEGNNLKNKEVVKKDKEVELTENKGRKIVEAKEIESNTGIAKIQVWDNRSIDGDIISIYHNGKLVEENINLLKKKKELSITLEKGKNVIVMHAVNLGEIPPNSAAMNISTGKKKYFVELKSDTKKSESIVIYYYP